MEIGKLQARITADDRDYVKKMKGADQLGSQTAGKIRSHFSNLRLQIPKVQGGGLSALTGGGGGALSSLLGGGGQLAVLASGAGIAGAAIGGVAVAGIAAAAALKKLFTDGLESERMLQGASVAFQTLGMTVEQTQRHLSDLEALGIKTPFETQDLIRASLTMNAFGFSIKDRIADLTKLSDAASIAAAGTGQYAEAMQGVITALGQMRAKGKLSAEEMNQLAERGIPAWDLLAKKVTLTKEQLMRLSERGKLRGDVAAELLTGAMGDFAKGAGEKLSQTIQGRENALAEQYTKFARESSKSAIDAYGQSLDEGLGLMNSKLKDRIAEVINAVGGSIASVPLGVITSLNKTVQAYESGKSIGDSLSEGVTKGMEAGKEQIKKAAGSWARWVEDQLGIKSPSTVFIGIGMDAAAGFALGFEASKGKKAKSLIDVEKERQKLLDDLKKLRDDPAIKAMLDTIATAEGANYNTLFGGGSFDSFAGHPNQRITRKLGGKDITSTAAGRYQFKKSTWEMAAAKLGLTDFGPESQDLAAIWLMRNRGMVGPTRRGDIETALTKGNREWASLPGSPYGQPTKRAEVLMETYSAALEKLTGATVNATTAMTNLAAVPARGQMIQGGEVVNEIIGKADLVPLAEIPKDFARLSDETTKARAALQPVPLPLKQMAGAAKELGESAEEATRRLKGSKTFAQLQKEAEMDAREALDPEARFERFQDFKERLGKGFDDAINALITGSDRWQDVAKNIGVDFFNSLASEMMLAATGGQYKSIGGLLGGLASGLVKGIFGGAGQQGAPTGALTPPFNPNAGSVKDIITGAKTDAKTISDAVSGAAKGTTDAVKQTGQQSVSELIRLSQINADMASCACAPPQGPSLLGSILGAVIGGIGAGFGGGGGGGGSRTSTDVKVGSVFEEVPTRAGGGSVAGGMSYLVGERGPELFTPRWSGFVTNARDTQQMVAGQSITVINNFTIQAIGGRVAPETQQQIATRAGQGIQAALRRNA